MNQIELATGLKPAKKMEEVWTIFDPTLTMAPRTEYYIQRTDPELQNILQSRAGAVVEYENDDLWLDLRYVLKPYIKELSMNNK
jgi:hypothetical protein